VLDGIAVRQRGSLVRWLRWLLSDTGRETQRMGGLPIASLCRFAFEGKVVDVVDASKRCGAGTSR
jgi:hypothetical protein